VENLVLEAQWRLMNRNKNMQEAILEALEFVSREELLDDSEDVQEE
jgi:hypothetical protein